MLVNPSVLTLRAAVTFANIAKAQDPGMDTVSWEEMEQSGSGDCAIGRVTDVPDKSYALQR